MPDGNFLIQNRQWKVVICTFLLGNFYCASFIMHFNWALFVKTINFFVKFFFIWHFLIEYFPSTLFHWASFIGNFLPAVFHQSFLIGRFWLVALINIQLYGYHPFKHWMLFQSYCWERISSLKATEYLFQTDYRFNFQPLNIMFQPFFHSLIAQDSPFNAFLWAL